MQKHRGPSNEWHWWIPRQPPDCESGRYHQRGEQTCVPEAESSRHSGASTAPQHRSVSCGTRLVSVWLLFIQIVVEKIKPGGNTANRNHILFLQNKKHKTIVIEMNKILSKQPFLKDFQFRRQTLNSCVDESCTFSIASSFFFAEEARTSQEPEAGTSRRESTGSDRASINRMRDIQRQEVLDLIRCLSDITDRLHVSRDLNEGHLESGSFRQDFGQNFALHSGSTPQPGTSYGHHRHNSRPLTANSILYPGTTETPSVSLMQIRFDEFPSYPSFGELPYFREHAGSGIRTYHTNREPDPMRNPVGLQSRSSFSRLQDSEPAGYSETEVEVPGYYPAVMLETESGNQRTIPSNPAPIKTLGQFGMGMFDLCTPIGLTTAHQGNTVLVSDQSQCRILMFDLESGEMQGSIKCEGEIKDLTVSTMGHILVATHKAGSSLATAYTFDGHKIASLGERCFVPKRRSFLQ